MAHTITPGPRDDIYILTYTGDLGAEELVIDDELHLNEDRPIYLLVDTSRMNNGLPIGFIESIQHSFVIHPQLECMAVYLTSTILRATAGMVIKLTRRKDRITLHDSYEDALQHLVRMAEISADQNP